MEFLIFSNDAINAFKYIESGVTKICVDIESIGKKERQSSRNTFISDHVLEDVISISRMD